MSSPVPTPTLTPHAKSIIAAVAAVVVAGVTAGQQLRGGTFHLADVLPVAVVVLGAIQTHLIPNVPELPWAKAVVSAASSVLAAVATLVASDPSGVTAAKLLTVTAGAFLVWFVPEAAPEVRAIEGALMGPDLPADPAPAAPPAPPAPAPVVAPAVTPRQVDSVPSSAYALRDVPAPALAVPAPAAPEPTPIHDEAAAAITAPLPTVPTA